MTSLDDMNDYQTSLSTDGAYAIFPKLRSDNYLSWSANMESVLRSLNQWELVNGRIVAPVPRADANSAPTTAQELQLESAWELRKQRAYAEIDLRVEDLQRVSIRGDRDNPRKAWETLRNLYGSSHLADSTRAMLLTEITRVQYDGGSGILEHKARMDALRLKLNEAGVDVSETLYLDFFINSLPEEFDAAICTIDFNRCTVDNLVNNLRQIEVEKGLHTADESSVCAGTRKKKRQESRSSSTSTPQGNVAQGAKGNTPKKSSGRYGKCYNCGGQGHFAKNCSSPKKRDGGTQQERLTVRRSRQG